MVKVTGEPGGPCDGDAENAIDKPPSDPVADTVAAVGVVAGLVPGVVRGGAVEVEVARVVVVTPGDDGSGEEPGTAPEGERVVVVDDRWGVPPAVP
ncbi:MAG TPA: hypothetical protein VNG12_03015 [Acidimicrobiales bacterium]|nr:hypothetical protein [Acidimicrobiales bacterium]